MTLTATLGVWLVTLDAASFLRFISAPDSASYTKVAAGLARGTLPASPRTLGYPLLMAPAYLLAGEDLAPYLVVGVQLISSLGVCALAWRILERMAPAAPAGLRSGAVVFVCWAYLGMAAHLLTDMWAGLAFSTALYGLLFWRRPAGVAVAASCLAFATLLRPTFTFVPLLLPLVAVLVRRISSPPGWKRVAALALASGLATGISIVYQYACYRYLGPSDVLTMNIERFFREADASRRMSPAEHRAWFEEELSRRTGRHYGSLSPHERESAARGFLRERLWAEPLRYGRFILAVALKYIFCPVESILQRILVLSSRGELYHSYLRPLLFLACLPVWALAIVPPKRGEQGRVAYYLLVMVFLVYVVGLTLITPGRGERVRLPLLVFLMPISVWNASRVRALFSRRRAPAGI